MYGWECVNSAPKINGNSIPISILSFIIRGIKRRKNLVFVFSIII